MHATGFIHFSILYIFTYELKREKIISVIWEERKYPNEENMLQKKRMIITTISDAQIYENLLAKYKKKWRYTNKKCSSWQKVNHLPLHTSSCENYINPNEPYYFINKQTDKTKYKVNAQR